MKKIVSLLLVLVMAASVMTACTGKPVETTPPTAAPTDAPTDAPTEAVNVPASAVEVLENVWALYADAEKFPIGGGDPENMTMDAPGNFDVAQAEGLSATLHIPVEEIASIDGAATMLHMMNANTFSSGVVHLAAGTDAAAFATMMQEAIKNTQWMCGFPEKLLIASVGGEYVVVAFGVTDLMDVFAGHLAEAYADAEVLVDEPIV